MESVLKRILKELGIDERLIIVYLNSMDCSVRVKSNENLVLINKNRASFDSLFEENLRKELVLCYIDKEYGSRWASEFLRISKDVSRYYLILEEILLNGLSEEKLTELLVEACKNPFYAREVIATAFAFKDSNKKGEAIGKYIKEAKDYLLRFRSNRDKDVLENVVINALRIIGIKLSKEFKSVEECIEYFAKMNKRQYERIVGEIVQRLFPP